MSLFADKNTNLQLGSFTIPSSWFQSVNSFFIIAFAPIFAWMWVVVGKRGLEPSTPLKMSIGLALIAIGFGILMIGGSQADTGVKVSPMFLIGAFLFHTFGELCLSPVGLSYVTKVAPVRFASLLMGVWFLANAAANKVAGFLAGYTPLPGEAAAARRPDSVATSSSSPAPIAASSPSSWCRRSPPPSCSSSAFRCSSGSHVP